MNVLAVTDRSVSMSVERKLGIDVLVLWLPLLSLHPSTCSVTEPTDDLCFSPSLTDE